MLTLVPDGKREDTVEHIKTFLAVLDICFQYDLGIGVSEKAITALFKPVPYLCGVVQLAVVDERAVAERHRLSAVIGINDDKPPVRETDVLMFEKSVRIGSARRKRTTHFTYYFVVDLCSKIDLSCNSAHNDRSFRVTLYVFSVNLTVHL